MSEAAHLVNSKRIPFIEPNSMSKLKARNLWSDTDLVKRLESNYFSKVILGTATNGAKVSGDLYSEAALQMLGQKYDLKQQIGPFQIYQSRR